MEVERILGSIGTTKLPDSPSFLEGIIKYEEEVIPVINLSNKFGFNSCSVDSTNKVIVVKKELGKFGVIVDDVNEVTTVNEATAWFEIINQKPANHASERIWDFINTLTEK